ncbi:hypothetical protein niasHS_016533 [Heterodera schachtii]|uniref:Uncharacterized protein n=1 Tax=Heterodera schachtii TaxID=97005 RepID=A0ABD2HNG7_HETSC
MPSNSFYVVVPSNTNIEGNRTNSFRVRLPRKLQFNSEWEVGLAVIVYPHSWPSIGTVEQQFVQVEWQTGNTVRIELPPSNVTNPHELGKNLYRLLGEGSDPLAKKVRSTQNSFMLTINKARRWAREEYIKRKTKEKRGVRDEELLLQALLTDTGTVVDLNIVTHGLLAREKRAKTSNIALRIPADDTIRTRKNWMNTFLNFTNELSFPINAKKNFLGSTGYYHTVNQDDSTDEGFKERCKIFKGGKNAQFLSRLDFDLGNQELYLLNNLDLLFTIYKAKDVFLLQTLKANDVTKYRLTVHDVKIYAKMVEVQPSLNMSLYKTLEKQPATYAVRKTEIKSSFISVGRYEFEYNVFSATIPRRVTIALVGNSAFHGDYKLSPFMFEPFDLREISIHAGGVVYPAVPYKLNFSKDHFVSAFVDMYEALGMANSERSFDISMAQFKKGWSFFVIPLTSTLDDSCGFELLRSGTTNVRATFNSPIPLGGVEMIVLGEFDQMIMVDYNRHIVTDSKLG